MTLKQISGVLELPEGKDYNDKLLEILKGHAVCQTGNLDLDSLINHKLQHEVLSEAEVTCRASIPKDIKYSPVVMTMVLGNLLDNAIEAISKLTTDRWLTIQIQSRRGTLLIEIANPFDGTYTQTSRFFQTRKKDVSNHGLGLKGVERTLSKNGGAMDVEVEGKIFKVTVQLEVE